MTLPTAPRAAIYARVSTFDQEPENQLQELRRYVEARGWTGTEFVDRGVSGSKEKRPALDALLKDAKRRRFDVLVCWRLDRLGRNLRHLVTMLEELQHVGVAFVSMGEGIDCTTPAGKLQLHIPRGPGGVRARAHPRAGLGGPTASESARKAARTTKEPSGNRRCSWGHGVGCCYCVGRVEEHGCAMGQRGPDQNAGPHSVVDFRDALTCRLNAHIAERLEGIRQVLVAQRSSQWPDVLRLQRVGARAVHSGISSERVPPSYSFRERERNLVDRCEAATSRAKWILITLRASVLPKLPECQEPR